MAKSIKYREQSLGQVYELQSKYLNMFMPCHYAQATNENTVQDIDLQNFVNDKPGE